MKFWIIISILAIALLVVLFWKPKSGSGGQPAAGGMATQAGSTDPLVEAIANMAAAPAGGTNCTKDCDKLCGSLGIFKGRWKCERECRSACASGQPYKTMFP